MLRFLLALYSLLYSLLAPLFIAFSFWSRPPSRKPVIGRRLGPPETAKGEQSGIWIHAVSVGEVNAVRPLCRRLNARGFPILLSTTTSTGQAVARSSLGNLATIFYFPFDLRRVCRRYLKRLEPRAVLLAETELWPNFILECSDRKIPLMLINGRISDRSLIRYRRIRLILRPLLDRFDRLCMQSKQDKKRILELGAPAGRVNWVGNLKYDYPRSQVPELQPLKTAIRKALQLEREDRLLFLCGSTKPGEEEILLRVYSRLRREHSIGLLIAPRHPHRAGEVRTLLEKEGIGVALRSELEQEGNGRRPLNALILDTVGELASLYELADLVFMGGSLVPTGGQNVIEPAAFGRPILFGPHMTNFRQVADDFVAAYAALQVSGEEELFERLRDLAGDAHARHWLGRNARRVIRDNRGAVERTVEFLEQILEEGKRC